MSSIPTHPTRVATSPPIPSDLEVGSACSFTIEVACAAGCDLRRRPVTIVAPSGVVLTTELATFADKINGTAECTVTAPTHVGNHEWSLVFARCEDERGIHEESRSPMAFRTTPHPTSMAVWDVPAAVVVNRPFTVKVGVTCESGCTLGDSLVEIRDETGETVGEARLGDAIWPGSVSLYWAAVTLMGPGNEGVLYWSAGLAGPEAALPHDGATASFSFRAALPPEHTITIEVTGQKTGRPIEAVEVRLGAYTGFTDARGQATVEVPTGTHRLSIRRDGYTLQPLMVDVREDMAVQVQAMTIPTKAQTEAPVGIGHPYAD